MKLPRLALICGALLLAACESTTPPDTTVEGEYSLARIHGTAINGQPILAYSGALVLNGGAYEWEERRGMVVGDTGTVRDWGTYMSNGTGATLSSGVHVSAGPNGTDIPLKAEATLRGDTLEVVSGSWVYYWARH